MNLAKAVTDNAPQALDEIDARIAALLKELRDLHTRRVSIAMHLCIATLHDEPEPETSRE